MFFRRFIEWFAYAHLSESYLPRSYAVTFPNRSPPRLFTSAALGGLKPAPASRLRGAKQPSSFAQLHTLYFKVRSWHTIWRASCENWSADNLGTENDITTDRHLIPGTDILYFLTKS
jgi:hypothetical protein